MQALKVAYRFFVGDAPPCEYEVAVEPAGGAAVDDGEGAPQWVALEFHQCPNCPLRPEEVPLCPVARRLPPLMAIANRLQSYDRVTVEVQSRDRLTRQETSAQRALSSLLGLVMAISGCPRTEYLRPMASFHLPLADEAETVYRATSMYLLAQYFRHRQGASADMGLEGLTAIYRRLQTVNLALANRLRAASEQDTAANAVVLLDLFAKGVPYLIADSLEELRPLFSAYLDDAG